MDAFIAAARLFLGAFRVLLIMEMRCRGWNCRMAVGKPDLLEFRLTTVHSGRVESVFSEFTNRASSHVWWSERSGRFGGSLVD